MKRNFIKYIPVATLLATTMVSCDDFLDKEPPSYVVPEDYYQSADQLQAVVNKFYVDVLPSHGNWSYGLYGEDRDTDNQAYFSAHNRYATGLWQVPHSDNDNWKWDLIRNINYSLNTALANKALGVMSGSESEVNQYIGELYALRAYEYFKMLQRYGDLPIVMTALNPDEAELVAASNRQPRNEVARFIISDMEEACELMSNDFDKRRVRLNPDAVKVLISRVALFEASWLENFKGTPFVPNGEGWPGKAKDYNADYHYPSGSIENEIKFFYEKAVAASEEIAEKYKNQLSQNTGLVPQTASDPANPYMGVFGNIDASSYPEVLLWRQYSNALGINCFVEIAANKGNNGVGLTRSMVEGFVMSDGKPIYAAHDGFSYDDTTLGAIRANADPRLKVFLKQDGQKNLFLNLESSYTHGKEDETEPLILETNDSDGYSTGYTIRKGGTYDKMLTNNGASYNSAIVVRATEALLNYIEAEYALTNSLTAGNTLEYWKKVREIAGFQGDAIDPMTTINATDISKEKLDWGSYTAGVQLTDKIQYNIRRERRCELMAEALRYMDLCRWRSMEQMITEKYHVEGFHLWNTPMEAWYNNEDGTSKLRADGTNGANVSSKERSEYLRPYEKNMSSTNWTRDGYTWHMAHYLRPLPIKQFLLSATDHASVDQSPLYQNPYWPTESGASATK